jgi:DnaJ-class molecular chaperone
MTDYLEIQTVREFTKEKYTKCHRCDGLGRIDHFRHVAQGECFKCYGTGSLVEYVEAQSITTSFTALSYLEDGQSIEGLMAQRKKEKENVDIFAWFE